MTAKLLILVAAIWAVPGWSLVNAERFRTGKFVEGFSGNVDSSVSLTQGNVDVLDVGARGRLQYQTRNANTILDQLADELARPEMFGDRLLLISDVRFAENADVAFLNRFMTHFRWTHMFREWIGSEAYGQYQTNQFTLSRNRSLAGAGVRIEVVRQDWGHIWFGTGYMAEYENINLAAGDTTHQPNMLNHRNSTYITAKFPIGGTAMTIQNTLYFQPRWDDPADFRALEVLEVEVDVTSHLSLLTTLEIEHDNRPPLGIKKTDTHLKNSLRFAF